jgi:hypothetical protein
MLARMRTLLGGVVDADPVVVGLVVAAVCVAAVVFAVSRLRGRRG